MKADDTREAVPWEACLPYERTEALNDLRKTLAGHLFAADDLAIKQVDNVSCIAGHGSERLRGLHVEGNASPNRLAAINLLESRIRKTANDFWIRCDFGVCICDELPPLSVVPIGPVSLSTQAKRLWHRARWAMRCGVLKKIGEARGMNLEGSESSILSLSTGQADMSVSAKKIRQRRSFLPMTLYHAQVSAPTLNLSRFAANNPCVIVCWASWDAASIKFLEDAIFPFIVEAASDPALADDPWLNFALKYVDFKSFHEAVALNLPVINRYVASHQRHTAAGQATVAAADAAKEASTVRQSIPAAYRSFIAFKPPPSLPREKRNKGDDSDSSGSDEDDHDEFDTTTKEKHHHKKRRKKRHSRWQVSNRSAAKQISIKQHTMSLMEGMKAQGRRRLRLGHIVLVNMDSDAAAATHALRQLHDRIGNWSSSVIGLHSVWVGEDGMHSEVANFLNPTALPFICAAQPERVHTLEEQWYEVPLVTLVQDIRMNAPRRPNQVGDTLAYRTRNDTRVAWHELPPAQRQEYASEICTMIEGWQCQLSFEATCSAEYDILGPPLIDSALQSAAKRSSSVVLRGTITESMRDHLLPILRNINDKVRGVFVEVQVIENSAPLRLPFNERTPLHRVKGWKADVTCVHCERRVVVDSEDHFQCLHCDRNTASVCPECLERHDKSHIVVWIPKGSPASIPLLWGHTNVARLPLIRGRLVPNETGVHVGVFCDSCMGAVKGVRWKCCFCPDVDLCAECYSYWLSSAKQQRKERRHPSDHTFLRVSCAVPGDANVMLTPRISRLQL